MDSDSPQLKELREALLSAFPTRHDLERMVFDGLGEHLLALVTEGSLQQMVFELLRWAVARGRLEELVIAALKQNHRNPQLLRVAQRLGLSDPNLTRSLDTNETMLQNTNESSITPRTSSTTHRIQSLTSNIRRRYTVLILGGVGLIAVGGVYFIFYLKPSPNGPQGPIPTSSPTLQADPTTRGDKPMSDWTLKGNGDTNPISDFLGTTDGAPLIIKTNKTEAVRIDANQNVGIGTTQPAAKLHVIAGPIRLENANTGNTLNFFVSGSDAEVYSETSNLSVHGRNGKNVLLNPYGGGGNVGVGTTAPGAKLHVEGDVYINGSFKKTGGGEYVSQTNPVDPAQDVVYATPVGGEVGTYIRGTGKLTNGEAEIELPKHFDMFTSESDLTVQLTPRGEWLQLYVVHLDTKRLIIREAQSKSGQFDYFVQGMRKGYENHQVFQEKTLTSLK